MHDDPCLGEAISALSTPVVTNWMDSAIIYELIK